MVKELWLNLPVKSIKKSRDFFTKMGFSFNPRFGEGDNMAGLMVGTKGAIVMLIQETQFEKFARVKVADVKQAAEVLISIDAESRSEVEDLAKKATAAGGILFSRPEEVQGWMYGCAFADPDGHRWNVLYMDMAKMPKG